MDFHFDHLELQYSPQDRFSYRHKPCIASESAMDINEQDFPRRAEIEMSSLRLWHVGSMYLHGMVVR